MEKVISIILLCTLFSFSFCTKEDETAFDKNGVAVKLPHLWKTSTSKNNKITNVVIATPIIYEEGKILIGADKDSKRSILSLNAKDGSVNWEWNDVMELISVPGYLDPIILYVETFYINDMRLFFTYGSSSYCIDLGTGQTLWKHKIFLSRFGRNGGIDNTYFTAGATYEPIDEEKIYFGTLESSEEEQLLLTPEYTPVENPPVNAQGNITRLRAFNNNGNTYLAFGIENPYKDFTEAGMGLTELNLYNITENKYEYEKIAINPNHETRFIADLAYQDGSLYFQSSNFIHGHDAMTGNELWRTYIGSAPLTSRMLLADNKLYSACENRYLYCVDINNGDLLWKTENTGTCSELSYLNGVLYYLGGGDGLLHAVDAQTGKHLWKIKSPDLSANSGAWFYGVCTAVPGKNGQKGVVVATTGLNAYGYEAIR